MGIIKSFKNLIEIKKILKGKAKLLSDFIISLMIIMTIAGIVFLFHANDFYKLVNNNEFLLEQTDKFLALNIKEIEQNYKSNEDNEQYLEKFEETYFDIQELNKKMYLNEDDIYKVNLIANISKLGKRVIAFESKEVLRKKLITLNEVKLLLYKSNMSNPFIEDEFIRNTNEDLEKLKTIKFMNEKEVINLYLEVSSSILFIGLLLLLIITTYLVFNLREVDRILIEAEKELGFKL